MKESCYEMQMEVYVNEVYAETYIKQIYENINSYPIELIVDLPNKNGIQFADFEVEIGDKKVKSKVIAKEKAEEKYSDAISSGNTGIYSEYNKNLDKYIIHLGNIEPNTKVYYTSHFLQNIISNDLNYLFRVLDQLPLPASNANFQNETYYNKIKIHFQTSSPLTMIEQNIQGNNLKIKNKFSEDRTKYEIELISKGTIKNNVYGNSLFSSNNDYIDRFPELSFMFQTHDYKEPRLYKQYDPKNNETTYLLSFFKTIHDENNNNKDEITKTSPGLYYFVIDQSGSMSGYPMSLVIKTLKVFMQSLSKGSYYQLIGFGSNYKPYSNEPLSYTKENVNKTIQDIENLQGDMGGTDLYNPLEFIYNNYEKDEKLYLPQHVFILTDGYSNNRQQILNIIEKNNSKYQVYAFGIGKDYDADFIRTAGECGFGSYRFIEDISNLSVVINKQLTKCMRVYYDKAKFKVENNNNEIIYDFYRNEFMLENQLVNYSFIMKGKTNGNIEIKNCYNEYGKELCDIFKFNENKIFEFKDGDILAKITMHNLIQKGKGKDFSEEEKIIKNAKKYQILCQYSSLYAEIQNTHSVQEGNLQAIQLQENINISKNTGGLFGNNNNNPNNGGSLFGDYNNTGGLFGNNNNNSNNTVGLFGNNNNNSNNTVGLFGNNNNNPNNTRSIFVNLNNYSNANGFFPGKINNSNNSGSLFGNNNNNSNNTEANYSNNAGSLFGNNNNNSNSSGSLFGNNNTNNTGGNHSYNIFGNNNNYSNNAVGLFGSNYNNSNNSKALFGNNNTSNLFGKNNNTVSLFSNNNIINNDIFENPFGNTTSDPALNADEIMCGENMCDENMYDENISDAKKSIDANQSDILENIIMSLDICEGCWEENQYTKEILDMKSNIYSQVKKLTGNNKIAVTFTILFYILNDRKESIPIYSNIINKAKTFLVQNNLSYEYIKSNIQIS